MSGACKGQAGWAGSARGLPEGLPEGTGMAGTLHGIPLVVLGPCCDERHQRCALPLVVTEGSDLLMVLRRVLWAIYLPDSTRSETHLILD